MHIVITAPWLTPSFNLLTNRRNIVMAKKILMVLTSHSELGNTGEKTGFWVEEFAAVSYTHLRAHET